MLLVIPPPMPEDTHNRWLAWPETVAPELPQIVDVRAGPQRD